MFVSRGNKLWITTLCPCLRTWCWTAGAPTVPCPYTKYLGSVRNKGAENIGLDENRGIGKECRYKTMEQRTGGNSQENVFGWTTKCTNLFFRVACLAVWEAICLFSCTVTILVLTSRTTHRLTFLFRQTQHNNLSNAWQRAPASGFRPKNEQRVDVSNPMESVLPDQLSYETLFTFPVFRTVGRERIP